MIPAEWTPPDDLELDPADFYDSANHNSILGNLMFLATAPQVAVRLTVDQPVAHNSDHTILWDTATWTSAGDLMWDPLAPSKVIVTRAGTFDLSSHVLWKSTIPVDDQTITLYVNGAARIGPVKGAQLNIQSTNLALNDELEIVTKHQFGAPVDMEDTQTRFTARWVGFPPTEAPP